MDVVLVHGGLYEDMDARRFWERPGIAGGLRDAGLAVVAPDRPPRPADWREEAAHLAALISRPAAVVAGSNGCSAAVRLAVDYPDAVARLVLCWPATRGDPAVDGPARRNRQAKGVPTAAIGALLGGETLRGVADRELAALGVPVTVLPSRPENLHHQRRTVEALCALIPQTVLGDGFTESPRPDFPSQRDAFVEHLLEFLRAR
jgi:pimeloyl-ACP methyl ester carboxylesterase